MNNQIIAGRVGDAYEFKLIPHAKVFLTCSTFLQYRETKTDEFGYFEFNPEDDIREGRHAIEVFADGFDQGLVQVYIQPGVTACINVAVPLSYLPEVARQQIDLSRDDAGAGMEAKA